MAHSAVNKGTPGTATNVFRKAGIYGIVHDVMSGSVKGATIRCAANAVLVLCAPHASQKRKERVGLSWTGCVHVKRMRIKFVWIAALSIIAENAARMFARTARRKDASTAVRSRGINVVWKGTKTNIVVLNHGSVISSMYM